MAGTFISMAICRIFSGSTPCGVITSFMSTPFALIADGRNPIVDFQIATRKPKIANFSQGTLLKYMNNSAGNKIRSEFNLSVLCDRTGRFQKGSLQKTHRIITMAAIMNDTYGTNKPGYDKIAILGFFIAALLMAHLIIVFKSRILFSDPIRLSHTGLSVSMPIGQSWQSDVQWQYQENMFSLSSLFPHGSDIPTTRADCRYLLSAEATTPQMRFEQRPSEIDALVAEKNQTQTNTLTVDWARIDKPQLHFSMFFGPANLPDTRQLDTEVSQIAGDGELAELVFKHIIETLIFEDIQLLKAGVEIVAEIKSKGLAGFLDNQNRQAYFLIKDTAERTIGFTMDVIVETGTEAP